ncbi:uncharacterized protein LOC130786251 [Actinidia eriantha]|uniref:uncharacterized protein LOC130786251 n=1 Tax=Actinidia eriantha TaxID=165200 RepID=UPI002584EF4D|nr:uncharacterized protein LOC130786251 [Actinidia eriantha]
MELRSACCGIQAPQIRLSSNQRLFSHHTVSPSLSALCVTFRSHLGFWDRRFRVQNESKAYLVAGLKKTSEDYPLWSFKKGVTVYASKSNPKAKVSFSRVDGAEPLRGKSGSVSFNGLTYHTVEEGKLESAPFKENTGSYLWVLAPVVFISSLVLPQFFLNTVIEVLVNDEILSEIVASFISEVLFYIGLAMFLLVTDRVQKPYLEFSSKRWSLITGLRGYMSSAFFTTGFKVLAPLFAVFITWPVLGLPALVAVGPFLAGCLAQLAFESRLARRGSSAWPLVPIIFEVYRLYQLTKAAHFIQRLMFTMKDVPVSPDLLDRSGAMVAMLVTFQVVGAVCLWSWLTLLLRLFPSRPVAENY